MHGKRGQNTRAVHAGRSIEKTTGAVSPPIFLSTTFARQGDGELVGDYLYGRHGNPNRRDLELCLADLEGAALAMAFGSGCAAMLTLASCLAASDRLVVSDDMYFGIRSLLRQLAARGHFELRETDMRNEDALADDMREPAGRLVVTCESPSNPMMHVLDIEAIAELTHRAGGELVVDNTLATPVLQRPLSLGADYVVHSTTKYIGGHSDVIGGALLCANPAAPLWQEIALARQLGGAVPSPFDCWLLLRSIATLVLRVERQSANAERLAAYLSTHPAVDKVLYPGLPCHPGFALAKRQMRLPGAMLSVLVTGGDTDAARFLAGMRLVTPATSLGGVHTLAEHRARIEGPNTRTPRNLVRLSLGIEDYEDIEQDVAQALDSR